MPSCDRSAPRRLAAALTVAVVTILLLPAAPARAEHASHRLGVWRGFSSGSAIHLDAVSTSSARLADLEVGVANAAVSSTGLRPVLSEYSRRIVPPGLEEKHARGHSSVAEVGVALSPPDAENQIRPFLAEASAPGDEPVDKSALRQAIGSAAFVDVAHNEAAARWDASSCVVGAPLAEGAQHLARVELLETGDDDATPASSGFDKPVAGVDATAPRRAATSARAFEQLVAGTGPGLALMSAATATVAPVTLFQGTPNEFQVEVGGPATLAAVADGTRGGASIRYRAPLVRVVQAGTERVVLPSEPLTIRIPGSGDALAQVKVGVVEPLPGAKGVPGGTTARDGTRAAAQVNVVEIRILDAASQEFRGATLAIGHLEASALVPAGGIECPLPVTKVADPPAVRTGQSFTVTITVRNPYACPVTDVRVQDDITTQRAARFEITGSRPAADRVPRGSNLAEGSVVWNDIGSIAPGRSKSVTLTMEAQGSAGRIIDTVTAGGTLENCPAGRDEDGVDVIGVVRTRVPVRGTATLAVPESHVLGAQITRGGTLARTGVAAGVPLGLGLLGAGVALAVFMRRTPGDASSRAPRRT